jgi:hypothetical protein
VVDLPFVAPGGDGALPFDSFESECVPGKRFRRRPDPLRELLRL